MQKRNQKSDKEHLACMLRLRNVLWLVGFLLFLLSSASCSRSEKPSETGSKKSAQKTAAKLPPAGLSLSAVLKTVESAGYAPVIEVEFENDHWEIKAYRNGELIQLKVGLLAGDILPNPAPTLEKPPSAIIKDLEDRGYSPILDVERAAGKIEAAAIWEIETYKGKSEVTVSVESGSGNIITK